MLVGHMSVNDPQFFMTRMTQGRLALLIPLWAKYGLTTTNDSMIQWQHQIHSNTLFSEL
jgi:hypothetical protein